MSANTRFFFTLSLPFRTQGLQRVPAAAVPGEAAARGSGQHHRPPTALRPAKQLRKLHRRQGKLLDGWVRVPGCSRQLHQAVPALQNGLQVHRGVHK